MVDISQINFGSSLSNITTAINQYVVAPLAAFGVGGFVFNAVGEATGILSADITDHYTEDNTAIQDQIAIRPKRITLKGYVGELVYTPVGNDSPAIQTLAQKLTSLSSFLPAITASAEQAQQAIANPTNLDLPTALGDASNLYGIVKNMLGAFGPTQNQQNAYNYFKALWQTGTLMGVQTPWEFMTNMAIESINVVQPENSMWISDFSVTFKEIRIAKTTTVPQSNASAASGTPGTAGAQSTAAVLAPAADMQQAAVTNLGPIAGSPVFSIIGKSIISSLTGGVF